MKSDVANSFNFTQNGGTSGFSPEPASLAYLYQPFSISSGSLATQVYRRPFLSASPIAT